MDIKKLTNIISAILIILTIIIGILFINVCNTIGNEIVDAGKNAPLFISLGVLAGVDIMLDLILGIIMGVRRSEAINGLTLFAIISSAFISILIFMLLFNI